VAGTGLVDAVGATAAAEQPMSKRSAVASIANAVRFI